jgi:hypothetical protein
VSLTFYSALRKLNTEPPIGAGPGLSHGIVNEPAYFTIVTKDAGAGRLFLIIIDKLHCIIYKLHVYQLLIIFYGKLILIGVFKSIVKIKTVY